MNCTSWTRHVPLHVHQWIEQKWSKKFASFVIPVAIFFLFVFSECYNSLANNVDLLMRSFPKPQCTQTWKVDHVSKGRREWLIKEKISIQEFMTWLISCSWQQIRVAHSPEFIPSGIHNFKFLRKTIFACLINILISC